MGRVGVHVAGAILEGQLGWRFREQHESDWGIDALVEIVSNGHPTGKIVALQIKAGQSWFQHRSHNGWTFYGTKRHRLYWLGHDLPVLVVLVDPRTGMAYWAHVTEIDAEPTASAFKLNIPEYQVLGPSAARQIEQIRRMWQPVRGDRWSRARDAIASCRAVGIPVAPSASLWDAFAASLPASQLSTSAAITFGLRLSGDAPATVKTAATDHRSPVRLTLEDLRGTWFPSGSTEVFVCENHVVVESVIRTLGVRSRPLIVLGGFPGKATEYLLLGLGFAGCVVQVHADHDAVGRKIKGTLFGQTIKFHEWKPCKDRALTELRTSRAEELCLPDLLGALRIAD
ncbi:Protein of unknown function C-terminus [Micromonospora pallida]|uniref:DUF4365 domain-containing protein n=2 Tax=Micromonospora pallida TaxID=145854 RepID=A0A1C6RT19_9ACTN|nr:Protein of unknown function C-terminus [Micromonospora pallida]